MPAATATTAEQGGGTEFSDLHPDVLVSHVLTRLDGPALGSAACCSATLRHLSSEDSLWSEICHSTWPSTASPRLRQLISAFPDGGARGFFSQAYPAPWTEGKPSVTTSNPPQELISAVDIHYKNRLVFTKVLETETVSGWFRCSPLRIDLVEAKEVVPTGLKHPEGEEGCREMVEGMALSWIVMDQVGGRAVNLSSEKAVGVQRHWLTGEVQVRYASILGEEVQCGIVVTCGGWENGEMHVREVSLEMEDMDGRQLNGNEGLVFLQGALEGRRGSGKKRALEGKVRYNRYVEMKRERRERKVRSEGALDTFCVALALSMLLAFSSFFLCS